MKVKLSYMLVGVVCFVLVFSMFGGFSFGDDKGELAIEYPAQTEINIGRLTFDVADGGLDIPAEFEIETYSGTSNGLYLVQFTQNTETWMLDGLESMGMTDYQFINRNTYLIEIPAALEDEVRALEHVQWLGIYQPWFKMSEEVSILHGEKTIEITLSDTGDVNHICNLARSFGGTVELVTDDLVKIVRVTIDLNALPELTSEPSVVWVSLYHPPQPLMNRIRQSAYTGADTPYTGGYTGTIILGQVKDNGCDLGHGDLSNVIYTQGGVSTQAHGTCTTGIVFGTGAGDPDARGMLPDATGCFSDWGVARSTSIQNLWGGFGGLKNGLFESNSWSQGSLNGQYTSYTNQDDAAMYNYQKVLMLYALGNSNDGTGLGLITQDSAMKNGLGIGAIWHKDTATMSDDDYHSGGTGNTPSRGFAADTRMKPDLIACFDWIHTVDVSGGGGYSGGDYYNNFGGTSGATPIVAGQVGLAYEMYMDNYFGNNPTNGIPFASTIKAMMIADAYQYPLETGGNQITRNVQGWGSADIENVYDLGAGGHYIKDHTDAVSSGQTVTYYVNPTGGGAPLKVSLVWTDPEAASSTGSNPALINNLDLKVTAPDNTVYFGNNGLDDTLWTTPGNAVNYWSSSVPNSVDDLNNVENVFIQIPMAGLWTIEVTGHTGQVPQGPQAFSLVASGAQEGSINNPPIVTLGTPNGGEVWDIGSSYDITWTMSDLDEPPTNLMVTLDYSINGGSTFPFNIITDQTGFGPSGVYNWLVPNNPSSNAVVRITVEDSDLGTASDTSNSVFTINLISPVVQVLSPNGGESLLGGGNWEVTWTAGPGTNPLAANPISIDYSMSGPGGPWNPITANEPNDGTYTWDPVPALDSSICYVRVTAVDDAAYTGDDISDSNFKIDSTAPIPASNPNAELTAPNHVTISWTGSISPDVDHYEVYYILNGWDPTGDSYNFLADTGMATSYQHINVGINNPGSYYWQVRTFDVAGNEVRTNIQAGKTSSIQSTFANPSGWFMLGSHLVQSDTSLAHVIQGSGLPANWDNVQLYDAVSGIWQSNIVGRPDSLDDLWTITNEQGFWLHVTASTRFATAGYVGDMSIDLKAGWNLVPYPFAEKTMTTANIMAHLSANCPNYDRIEIFDSGAPYRLITPGGGEILAHGSGFWVKVVADSTWSVTNY